VIPILEKLDTSKKHIQALILVPTRELALQISSVVKNLGKFIGVECMVSTGGTSFKEDIYRLHKIVNIIVGNLNLTVIYILGTPGRILDLAYKNIADFSQTEVIVLDEADKLLSYDFQPIIEKIL